MKGVGVEKDLEKAKEIFTIGSETDPVNSLNCYKKAADQGHYYAKRRYEQIKIFD